LALNEDSAYFISRKDAIISLRRWWGKDVKQNRKALRLCDDFASLREIKKL
jgi:hypothetical protein